MRTYDFSYRNKKAFISVTFQLENMDLTQLCNVTKSNPNPTVLIQTFKSTECSSLYQTLEEINPRFIIMYHSDMSAVRQIEVTINNRLN